MLVYIYQATLWCEDCGNAIREKLTSEGKAPEDPEDEGSYDSDDFPKGPTEEGETDSPSHCDGCHVFLESDLTDVGANDVLERAESVLRGEQNEGAVIREWIDHYEGKDDRVTLKALADSGLTIAEILGALRAKNEEIARLKRLPEARLVDNLAGSAMAMGSLLDTLHVSKANKATLQTLLHYVAELLEALEQR